MLRAIRLKLVSFPVSLLRLLRIVTNIITSSFNNFRYSRALGGSNSRFIIVGNVRSAICGVSAYTVVCVLVGNTVLYGTHKIWTRQKMAKTTIRKLIVKCRCDALHSKTEQMRGKRDTTGAP